MLRSIRNDRFFNALRIEASFKNVVKLIFFFRFAALQIV